MESVLDGGADQGQKAAALKQGPEKPEAFIRNLQDVEKPCCRIVSFRMSQEVLDDGPGDEW